MRVTSCTRQTVTNILNVKGEEKNEERRNTGYILGESRRGRHAGRGNKRESENRLVQRKWQEMNRAEVRDTGSSSSKYQGRSYKD